MLRAPRKPKEELKRLIEDLGEAIGKTQHTITSRQLVEGPQSYHKDYKTW
jgi:uncharacterized membrane-anchored protein